MTDRAVPAWSFAVAGSLAAAIGLGAMLWFEQRGDGADPTGAGTSAAVPAGRAPATIIDSGPAASASGAQGPPAAGASATPTPAQVHEMFAAAVRKAREAAPAPPPPGIAKAKSFEEAFQAMRAAEPAPANPGAGAAVLNPFGAAR